MHLILSSKDNYKLTTKKYIQPSSDISNNMKWVWVL